MAERLEECLVAAACAGRPLTYAELAARLQLRPPHRIHRTAMMLEDLMREQAGRGEPQLASMVISRARAGLPAPGFFILLRELGLYDGPEDGQAARQFLARERKRCVRAFCAGEG